MTPPIVYGDSKEAVAYALMICIAGHAERTYLEGGTPIAKADEKWVLETYARCLRVVHGQDAQHHGIRTVEAAA